MLVEICNVKSRLYFHAGNVMYSFVTSIHPLDIGDCNRCCFYITKLKKADSYIVPPPWFGTRLFRFFSARPL